MQPFANVFPAIKKLPDVIVPILSKHINFY